MEQSSRRRGPVSQFRFWLQRRLDSLLGKGVLLIALVLVLTFGGATVIHVGFGQFPSYGEAVWWAFAHLLDPGSVDDDEQLSRRLVGVILVICGLILLAGILFALLTDVVSNSLQKLTDVDPPIDARGHLLIIGWNEAIPDMLSRLSEARRPGSPAAPGRHQQLVVLAPPEWRQERERMLDSIRRAIGQLWDDPQCAFAPIDQAASYDLVAAGDARAIVITTNELPGRKLAAQTADAANIQTGVMLARYLDDLAATQGGAAVTKPLVSVTLFWGEHADAAMAVIPPSFDCLVIDRMITALVAVDVTNRAWSQVLRRLVLQARGARAQLVSSGPLCGRQFGDLITCLNGALPIGFVRGSGGQTVVDLAPPPETVIADGDAIVVFADDPVTVTAAAAADRPAPIPPPDLAPATASLQPTLLVIGLNHRICSFLAELAAIPFARFRVILLSRLSEAERGRQIPTSVSGAIDLHAVQDIPSDIPTLQNLVARHNPETIVVSGDWAEGGDAETVDAEGLFNVLSVKQVAGERIPIVMMPIASVANAVFDRALGKGTLPGGSSLAAMALAWSLFHPDVIPVYGELFTSARNRLTSFRYVAGSAGPVRFDALYQAVLRQGAILAGVVDGTGRAQLAPAGETVIGSDTELLVIVPVHQDDAKSIPALAQPAANAPQVSIAAPDRKG